jgi:hypothetical protein
MPKIEEQFSIHGFAWIEVDEDGVEQIGWAYREDIASLKPSERPEGCTPVVIEIIPTEDWIEKQEENLLGLGDISENLNYLKDEVAKLQKQRRAENSNG